ncbi:FecR family protein [Mariniphaga sediminis]|uniref:FecR family protein n=1 Tax=Mariniphaga sediminis TaxID=1628158 RepID=UPI00356137C5
MNKTKQDKIWELSAARLHYEASSADEQDLKKLLKHPENRKIYDDVTKLHLELLETEPLTHSSATRSWLRIIRYLNNKKISLYLNVIKYAAIIILAISIGTLLQIDWKPFQKRSIGYTKIFVPLGQMSELTLSDGTHVWLNSGTTLRYANNFGENDRKVKLDGEAFFEVKKDEIPFKVQIKNNEVEVLGTKFAAIAYPNEGFSQVTLVEGSIQLNDVKGRTLKQLNPRQQITLPDDPTKKIKTAEVNTTFYESWINGVIKFDNEKLVDVARRMERWYNVEIRFTSDEARNVRFTGTVLKNKPIDQSMKAICVLLPLEAEFKSNLDTKDVITISKK